MGEVRMERKRAADSSVCLSKSNSCCHSRTLCTGSISFDDDKAEPDQQLGSKSYFSDGNDADADDERRPVNQLLRSNSYDKQKWRSKQERQLSWQDQGMKPKVQKLDPQEHRRSFRGIGGSLLPTTSIRGLNSRGRSV
jgi:hypothetical protein